MLTFRRNNEMLGAPSSSQEYQQYISCILPSSSKLPPSPKVAESRFLSECGSKLAQRSHFSTLKNTVTGKKRTSEKSVVVTAADQGDGKEWQYLRHPKEKEGVPDNHKKRESVGGGLPHQVSELYAGEIGLQLERILWP